MGIPLQSSYIRAMGLVMMFFASFFLIQYLHVSDAFSSDDIPDYFVPPPPFSEGIYPCSDCHADLEVNETRRELDFHEDIVLKHAEEQRWCLDCHNPADRDKLRLANGQLISFETSYHLCGQCHGTIFRDWKAGVHGKRTGYWNGKKQYRLCVHCHNPHSPRYKPIEPLPPPIRPDELKYTKSEDDKIPRNPLTSNYKAERKDVKEKH
ncbi:MAG: hypothetical protein JSW20_05105 [Nitrospiraceae bacterium]|nr:MAG: hypothetical protein JSW20_05105 [Nitrospiraceae bacterium]